MQLLHLYELLVEAYGAVEANKTSRALFKLNRIVDLLEPIKNDYSDVYNMHQAILHLQRDYWRGAWRDGLTLYELNGWIDLCESWIECRSRAA